MEKVFLKVLNMSITAGWMVLAALLLRPLLKKAPKAIRCALWGLVGLRLVLPFSIESPLSLIPSAETIPDGFLLSREPAVSTGVSAINAVVNPVIMESMAPKDFGSVNPAQVYAFVGGWLWVIGMAAMVIYACVSYFRVHRKVREAAPMEGNVWLCDHIDSPFILGVFRPKIYLPSSMAEEDMAYVIAHEKAHLRRRDHLWKPLGFLLLTVHWFNPLLWAAYILLCRDIEFACDEKVLAEMGTEAKKPYSEALINCSAPRRSIAACPLAFGEVGVKSRIKSVLHYRKPAFWIVLAAVVLVAAAGVCLLTDPAEKQEPQGTEPGSPAGLFADVRTIGYQYYTDEDFYEYEVFPSALREDLEAVRLGEEPVEGTWQAGTDYEWTLRLNGMTQICVGKDHHAIYVRQEDGTGMIYEVLNPEALETFSGDFSVFHIRTLYGAQFYDTDGDGVDEVVGLSFGPTSGVFSIMVTVWEINEGEPISMDWVSVIYGGPTFLRNRDGMLWVEIEAESDVYPSHSYELHFENGQPYLSSEDQMITMSPY